MTLTDAAARVEEVSGTLARLEAKAKPASDVSAIEQELPSFAGSRAARRARDEAYLAGQGRS